MVAANALDVLSSASGAAAAEVVAGLASSLDVGAVDAVANAAQAKVVRTALEGMADKLSSSFAAGAAPEVLTGAVASMVTNPAVISDNAKAKLSLTPTPTPANPNHNLRLPSGLILMPEYRE